MSEERYSRSGSAFGSKAVPVSGASDGCNSNHWLLISKLKMQQHMNKMLKSKVNPMKKMVKTTWLGLWIALFSILSLDSLSTMFREFLGRC